MHVFEIVAEPVRRRIIEVLAVGEHTVGNLNDVISVEFGVSRSAVWHHLRILRDEQVVTVRHDLQERWYMLDEEFLERLDHAGRRPVPALGSQVRLQRRPHAHSAGDAVTHAARASRGSQGTARARRIRHVSACLYSSAIIETPHDLCRTGMPVPSQREGELAYGIRRTWCQRQGRTPEEPAGRPARLRGAGGWAGAPTRPPGASAIRPR
ncbi:ArsR/SmtB family transcription factor [Agromyces humatus]